MDSLNSNTLYRSVPLIQRGGMAQLGGRTSAERDAAVDTSKKREHVSAYMGESTAGRATKRSERRRAMSWEGQAGDNDMQRRATGLALVSGGSFASPRVERSSTLEPAVAGRTVGAGATALRSGAFDDYEYASRRTLPGSENRRNAVIRALCFVPETVGSAVLGLLAHVRAGGVAVAAVILLMAAALYGPARDLYIANRKLDAMQKTYDALQAENSTIQEELDYLQTREGIENEARARGYVEPGETKVVVNGLSNEDAEVYELEEIEVPDESPWYIRVLDAVFDYESET